MEEIIPNLKTKLKNAINWQIDEKNLKITLHINSKFQLKNNFADPQEVNEMLINFSDLNKNDLMGIEILVFENVREIHIICKQIKLIEKIESILEHFPEFIEEIMKNAWNGNSLALKNIEFS
jgi:hypothetical protein